MRAERREDVAEVERVVGVSVEVGADRQPGSRDLVDHGSVAQDGQVEAVAVEGDELRVQLRDPVDERRDQLLLGPLADVRRAEGVNRPVIGLSVCDEGADADDRVVDVLGELVADHLANLVVGLADEVVGGCEPARCRGRSPGPRR